MTDEQDYRQQFTEQGEAHVRDQLHRGRYNEFKAGIARSWLDALERARAAGSDSSEAEDRARALQLAAEANAIAAKSVTIAHRAFYSSLLAVLVAIGAVIASFFA
jgi:GTP cyclohydrolase III